MTSCEKCWRDAGGDPEAYRELIELRSGDDACTPEQQAGLAATQCPKCDRKAVHEVVGRCMACEWSADDEANDVCAGLEELLDSEDSDGE